jgi:hypothetical protein
MASEELQEETEFDDSRDRVRRLSEQEIIKLFKRYNFRDDSGTRSFTALISRSC